MATSVPPNITNNSRRKMALVIGINNYENGQNLINAENDAVDMTNTLKKIGFDIVISKLNLKYDEMEHALTDFKISIQKSDMVLFYFAGHGQQSNGENYLIPRDNKGINAENISERATSAQYILNIISERGPYITIFILDCCRTNAKKCGRGDAPINSQSDGFKAMSANAGSLIAFACAPGTISNDGDGERNGLFTKHLLKHITVPNEDIRMILADVTDGVMSESESKQIPFISATIRHKNIFLFDQFPEVKQPSHTNQKLEEYINENKNHSSIYLNRRQLTDNDMEIVCRYLLKNKVTLTELSLCINQIGDRGAEHLAEVLKTNKTLTHLNISDNQIGVRGAQCLAEALKTNTILTELYLHGNQIGDNGAQYLGDTLKENKTLTYLALANNIIGDNGAQELAEALKVNKTLTILILLNNKIGDNGAKQLAAALKVNQTLTRVNLANNIIGDNGAQELAEALKVNKTLQWLYLRDNNISNDRRTSLQQQDKRMNFN